MSLLAAAGVALAVALVLTRAFARPGSRLRILDYPNERSLHSRPVPRTGGIAILIGILAGVSVFALIEGAPPARLLWLGVAIMLVAFVSFLDDRRPLSPRYRLAVQIAAASLLLAAGLAIETLPLPGVSISLSPAIAATLTLLYVVWMTNLYNFMDGMDGFAGGMAIFGFGSLGTLAWVAGHEHFAAFNFVIAASAVGFLFFNFPPARIFMGDTGSSVLGFLAAGMSTWGNYVGAVPLWVSVLIFMPFIADATVTLLWRLFRGEKVHEGHKSHYYQRLVQLGWAHRQAVLLEYVLMSVCAVSAVVAWLWLPVYAQWALVGLVGLLHAAFFASVHVAEVRQASVRTLG